MKCDRIRMPRPIHSLSLALFAPTLMSLNVLDGSADVGWHMRLSTLSRVGF